jgi:hypothetical protein
MFYILVAALTLLLAMPAGAQQYFKNHCAWDASSHCAAKRAQAARKR